MNLKLLAVTLTLAALPSAAETLFIRGGNIHTMAGSDIAGGSILIRDGKISGVGKGLSPPEGARVIDATGLDIYPGLIDSASEVGLSEIDMVRESSDIRELGRFNPQLSTWMAINPSSEHIPVTRANGITTVLALPDGELIAGRASLIHLSGWTTDQMVLNKFTVLHIVMPVIRTRTMQFPEGETRTPYEEVRKKYERDLQELDKFFEDARRYAQMKAANDPEFRQDPKFEAMLPVLSRETPVLITAMREREIRAAMDFAQRQNVRMILSGAAESWKVASELKKRNIPVVLQPTLSLPLEEDDPYDRPFTTPGELQKAGVLFSFGSFSNSFSRNLPYQAAAAVPFGLSRADALAAITVNPAKIFRMDKEIGTIEEGKIADLIVTTGDPLETRTEVRHVLIAGTEVSLDNRQKQLYEKYSARPEPTKESR